MKFPVNSLRIAVILFSITLFSGCGLKPTNATYNFVKLEKVDLDHLGKGKILIYSGSDFMHSVDNSARLNVWIDNKSMGQLRPKEYLILDLPKGSHEFTVVHIDIVKMKSTHKVEINDDTKVIMIQATLTSNKLEVTNVVPNNIEKYNYMPNR